MDREIALKTYLSSIAMLMDSYNTVKSRKESTEDPMKRAMLEHNQNQVTEALVNTVIQARFDTDCTFEELLDNGVDGDIIAKVKAFENMRGNMESLMNMKTIAKTTTEKLDNIILNNRFIVEIFEDDVKSVIEPWHVASFKENQEENTLEVGIHNFVTDDGTSVRSHLMTCDDKDFTIKVKLLDAAGKTVDEMLYDYYKIWSVTLPELNYSDESPMKMKVIFRVV